MDKATFNRGALNDLTHLEWKSLKKEHVFTCPIFSINNVERKSTDGRQSTFVSVHSPNWIVVIPWFRDNEGVARFIMERQYRHGSETITCEFPAGLVEEGEEFEKAARRELLEETGAKPGKMTLLGNVSPNSAFMDNRQCFYFAEDLELVSEQSLDENEQIDVLSVPVSEAIENMGTGLFDNGIMMMAIGFFLRLTKERPELL